MLIFVLPVQVLFFEFFGRASNGPVQPPKTAPNGRILSTLRYNRNKRKRASKGESLKNNKVYFPVDALARHEDFDVWYEDGDVFLSIKSAWSKERDKVAIFGRMGGEMGSIKPDAKALTYYLKLERWEYVFHTLRIFEHYYINGMKWQIDGSLSNPPFDFVDEEDGHKEAHVQVVDFKGHGACFELKVRDVAKLRIATAPLIAKGIKEEYKGLSEGFKDENASKLKKAKDWMFAGRGKTYDELLEEEKHEA